MNVKRKLGCILAFSFICFSGCSSIEQPTFKDIMRDINSKHQSIEQENVDTTQYIGDLIKEEKLKEYYMTTFRGTYDSERVLSQQQILEDITYLFDAFHDMYGPYEYFGGAEVFNTVENEIKEEVKEYETLQAKDLEELLLKRLQFIKDGHFSINKKDLNPIKIPFFFRTHSFKKIKDGYETADGKKVRSIDGYKNLDELMKLSISPEGELVYYPVLLKNCDFRAALESPQKCEETLIIHYTNGNTEELKADSFQIYSDIDLEHPNRSKVISSRQSGEIPIFQFNQFVDRHEDRIFKGAVSLKEAPIAILDLQKEYARHGRKEYMARHSFIQMSKLHNVKGRISYITSHARQENLYATYRTADNEFWSNLARESQQEFKRSGTEGKCIEARELIIALPEIYTRYEPQEVLEDFTEEFRRRYGVECVSALHHNKRKTNYHIHLIFSERKLLPEPDIKRATRSVFYDETGKRVRTKKEITGEDGQIRKGCTVIKKGEVYESHLFTVKDEKFKSEPFLREVKEIYTDLINRHISDPEQQLKVFDKNSVYLPTKKIGKNNPKAAEIEADNTARQEWNRTADMALLSGISEAKILEVKQTEIHEKASQSIKSNGWLPNLFRGIVAKAKDFLQNLIREKDMPPKPTLDIDMAEFRHMRNLMIKLQDKAVKIKNLQDKVLPQLKQQLADTKGLFKGKERKALEVKIKETEAEIADRLDKIPNTLKADGYPDVQIFMRTFREMESVVEQYNRDLAEWEYQVSRKPTAAAKEQHRPPEKQSVLKHLREIQERNKQQPPQRQRKKSIDRDSR